MCGNKIFSLLLFFLIATIPTIAQDTIVSQDTISVEISQEDTVIVPVRIIDTIIPMRELYRNSWSTQHVRHHRLAHSDTTELELLIPEAPEFSMPVRNFQVISRYGMRNARMHTGIDLRQRPTDSIFAVFDGVVRMAKWYSSYGNIVVIRHFNGLETVYSHLSKIFVVPFQLVRSGEAIGLAGRTGRASTDHLHFEIRFLHEHFDPNLLIDFENESLRLERITFINGRLVKQPIEETEIEDESTIDESNSDVN